MFTEFQVVNRDSPDGEVYCDSGTGVEVFSTSQSTVVYFDIRGSREVHDLDISLVSLHLLWLVDRTQLEEWVRGFVVNMSLRVFLSSFVDKIEHQNCRKRCSSVFGVESFATVIIINKVIE